MSRCIIDIGSLIPRMGIIKLEQDFEAANNDYEAINNAMKTELPRFLTFATQFIDPLFHSFYYMQYELAPACKISLSTFSISGSISSISC